MNRRNFLRGVAAAAAGGALACAAKDRVEAEKPQATVVHGGGYTISTFNGVKVAEPMHVPANTAWINGGTAHDNSVVMGSVTAHGLSSNGYTNPPHNGWPVQSTDPILKGEEPSAAEMAAYNRLFPK
jgi:hypothetical protein